VDVVNVCIVPSLPFRIWGRRKHPRSGSASSIALEVGRNDRPTRTNSGSPKWLFTTDKPVIIAHHGYPMLIHRLTYRRTNHRNIHVRGYKEEGTTTTPFDMVVRNDLDRFHLASDVIDRVPKLGYMAAYAKQALRDKLIEHKQYITRHGDDMPEVKDWRWPAARA
jgi:xylulose-5-phosphate/fructose-6-phosphate phosphoketolase